MCLLNNTIQWNLDKTQTYLRISVNKTIVGGLFNERNRSYIQD